MSQFLKVMRAYDDIVAMVWRIQHPSSGERKQQATTAHRIGSHLWKWEDHAYTKGGFAPAGEHGELLALLDEARELFERYRPADAKGMAEAKVAVSYLIKEVEKHA